MIGRLLSSSNGPFSGAMLNFGHVVILQMPIYIRTISGVPNRPLTKVSCMAGCKGTEKSISNGGLTSLAMSDLRPRCGDMCRSMYTRLFLSFLVNW